MLALVNGAENVEGRLLREPFSQWGKNGSRSALGVRGGGWRNAEKGEECLPRCYTRLAKGPRSATRKGDLRSGKKGVIMFCRVALERVMRGAVAYAFTVAAEDDA